MKVIGHGVVGFIFGHTLAAAYLDNIPVMLALFGAFVIATVVSETL